MKRITSLIAPFLLATLLSGTAMAAGEIKIGTVLPLTGAIATFGDSTLKGIKLAVKEVNNAGGIKGKKISLITADSKHDPAESANAVRKLIVDNKVSVLIGDVASTDTLASAPIAQSMGIPMVTSASSNIDVTKVGNNIFRVCFTDPIQGRVMATFAAKNLKVKKVAILTNVASDYSKGLADVFKKEYEKLGGKVVSTESYSEGDSDFNAQLTKIKSAKADAIYMPSYYNDVALAARQAKQLDIKAPFLGADGFDSDKLYEIGGEAVVGSYFTNHYATSSTTSTAKAFLAAYKKEYKDSSPDALAALGYDAAKVVLDALKRSGDKPKDVRSALEKSNVAGATGNIKFDKDRNPIKSTYVLKVEKGAGKYSVATSITN